CPAGMPLVQLRAGRAEEKERHPLRPLGETLEEREQRQVCPMQVLEYEYRLPCFCPTLEHTAPRRERFLPRGGLAARTDERRQARLEPGEVGIVCGEHVLELHLGLGGGVGIEDAALGLDDFAERPEGDSLSVGKAAALTPAGQSRPLVDVGEE